MSATYIVNLAKGIWGRPDKWAFEDLPALRAGATFFLHIPKSAGTAFHSALIRALNISTAVSGFDHCLFGSFTDFGSIHSDINNSIYAPYDVIPGGAGFIGGHLLYLQLCVIIMNPTNASFFESRSHGYYLIGFIGDSSAMTT